MLPFLQRVLHYLDVNSDSPTPNRLVGTTPMAVHMDSEKANVL